MSGNGRQVRILVLLVGLGIVSLLVSILVTRWYIQDKTGEPVVFSNPFSFLYPSYDDHFEGGVYLRSVTLPSDELVDWGLHKDDGLMKEADNGTGYWLAGRVTDILIDQDGLWLEVMVPRGKIKVWLSMADGKVPVVLKGLSNESKGVIMSIENVTHTSIDAQEMIDQKSVYTDQPAVLRLVMAGTEEGQMIRYQRLEKDCETAGASEYCAKMLPWLRNEYKQTLKSLNTIKQGQPFGTIKLITLVNAIYLP